MSAAASDAGDAPASSASASAAPAAASASAPLRPSGRGRVKDTFIGITSTNVRRGLPPPAHRTALVQQLELDPYTAYFGSPLPLVSGFAGAAKKMGRPRGSEQLTQAVTQQQQQLAAATATQQQQLATPNGSMSARSTPIAGRRAAGPASGSSTARAGTVVTPRARVGLPPRRQQQQQPLQPKQEEEKNAAQQPMQQQFQQFLPAWLQPLPHSSYPAPQAPLSPVPGLPWPASGSAAADETAAVDAPRPSLLPPTYSYSFYQPAHPRRAKTDRSISPMRSESKQATHSRSSSPSRKQQQQTQKQPQAAPGETESWSSWPFVNPRLVREQQQAATTTTGPSAPATKEEKDLSVPSSAVPSLPGVPRLFGSVVSEHDRTLVFEYLRSTYSQLFQWPPQQPECAAAAATAADGSASASAPAPTAATTDSGAPPLPSIPFTDAQLERLIEEGHSAAGAIVLLRRLDAELALAVQSNTVGQPLRPAATAASSPSSESSPSPLDAALASRPAPRSLNSAAELVEVVAATAAYLASINRALFQWFVAPRSATDTPMALFARTQAAAAAAAAAAASSAAPAISSTSTVFVTQQMVDALIAESARGGMAEEELWSLLEQLNSTAVAATKQTGSEAERAFALQQHTFVNFDDLALAVRGHVEAKRRRMLNPNASTGELGVAAGQQPLMDGSGAPLLMNPSLLPTDPALMLLPPAPPQRPPSPAALRHASQSLSYARLLLFKFLRDDSPATATDDTTQGNGGGGGAALFAQARDVTASLAQMDSLIEATRGLTLGQNYHTMSYPRSSGGASTVTSPTAVTSRHVSREAPSQASSRHPTRPPSPSAETVSAAAAPTGTVAAATRAYGSFLAARAIRVLRSLLFHGYTFRSFDDLILAAHIHTRKLHAERLKVFQFLTQSQPSAAGATATAGAAGKKHASASTLPHPDAAPPADLVASLQALTHSNASGGIGLFDAYYIEVDRRERARILEEQARAEQLKLNTHQFGTSHLNHHAAPAVSGAPSSQQQHTTAAAGSSPRTPHTDRSRAPAKSAASKSFHSSISEADRLAERRRQRTAGAIPSHIVPAVVPPKHSQAAAAADAAKFDWGLSPPVVVSTGGSDPAAIRAMQQAIAANGGVMPLNSPTITRYASAKTLPNIASKSQLLKHVDSLASAQDHGAFSSTSGEYDAVQLDPLVVTPEHVDALFGSFEHLLTLNVNPAVAAPVTPLSLPAGVPAAAASQLPGVALASAPTPVFDPLLEQADEDLLLESEKEEAYNSMDLTLLLQQYKAERPHELEERERVPSYLAAHPLFQPMLEEAQKHSKSRASLQQPMSPSQQQKVLLTSDSQVFVMRSHGAPASSAASTGSPSVRFEPSPSETTEATAAEDPLNPSAGTTIPTLQSLLEVASQVVEANAAEHATAAEATDPQAPPQTTDTPERAAPFSIGVTAPSNEGTPVQKANLGRAAAEPPAVSIDSAEPAAAAAPASAPAPVANANPPQSFSSAAESFALDTSRDLVILDPNADFQRWAAMDRAPAPGDLGQSVDTAAATTAPVDPTAPLPKMLPVVWQTMQMLREQGKIKIHTSPPVPQPAVHGPAGAGSGAGLPSFIPNSGPLIPGGSLGSTKTLAILRELSAARRPFFSIQSLVSTVCSMRAERKWAKRAANVEKKKLLAAGITIAQPSGIPNDQMAAQQMFGVVRQKRAGAMSKQGSMANVHAATGAAGGAQPLSAAQFALLTTPQSLAGRNVRAIQVVDEEADDALAAQSRAAAMEAEQNGRDVAALDEGAVKMPPGSTHWGSASQKFLPPAAFPPSLHVPAFPAPPPQPGSHKKNASSSSTQVGTMGDAGFNESETRAWARSRLLAHLSGLLLFQGSAHTTDGAGRAPQQQVDVQIRMGDLESLLDALAQGPRDAMMLAEKLARKEREALEKEAAAAPMGEPRGDAALAALAALPPLSHPIAPLLALLSWLDKQEATFPTVQALVRSVSSGSWSHTFKQLERGRKQRVQTQSQMMAAQIAQQLEAIDQPI